MTDKKILSISEVVEASGLPSSALRYYERAGLIKPAGRSGGRRQYSASILRQLAVIALLREVGFTIKEISKLMTSKGKGGTWRALADAKLQEIDNHIQRVNTARDLLTSALECGCSTLDSCNLVDQHRGRHRRVTQNL